MSRHVDTPYGPMPGCPDCDVIALAGPHLCEHGVTSTAVAEASVTAELDRRSYDALVFGPQTRECDP